MWIGNFTYTIESFRRLCRFPQEFFLHRKARFNKSKVAHELRKPQSHEMGFEPTILCFSRYQSTRFFILSTYIQTEEYTDFAVQTIQQNESLFARFSMQSSLLSVVRRAIPVQYQLGPQQPANGSSAATHDTSNTITKVNRINVPLKQTKALRAFTQVFPGQNNSRGK